MVKVADFLHRAVQISLTLQKEAGSKLIKDFVRVATSGNGEGKAQLEQLAKDVEGFATSWPLPGVSDTSKLRKPSVKPQVPESQTNGAQAKVNGH